MCFTTLKKVFNQSTPKLNFKKALKKRTGIERAKFDASQWETAFSHLPEMSYFLSLLQI